MRKVKKGLVWWSRAGGISSERIIESSTESDIWSETNENLNCMQGQNDGGDKKFDQDNRKWMSPETKRQLCTSKVSRKALSSDHVRMLRHLEPDRGRKERLSNPEK
jgi:hypothetical protein